ncbi:28S ribosomal protein S2 [Mactra antiquata]
MPKLFRQVFNEFRRFGDTKGIHIIRQKIPSRSISTYGTLNQHAENKDVNSENSLIDPLEHHDYFDIRKTVTVKNLFLSTAHYGHVTGCRNPYMTPYLFGVRSGIDIIDLEQTVRHFQDALNFTAHIAYRNGIILFVSRNKMMMPHIEKTAKACGEYAHCRYWSNGIFTDMVSRLGQNVRLPDLAIFLNTQNSVFQTHKGVLDCAKMLIPTIGVVDTNCDPRLISYPIPANDDSFRSNMLYLSLFEAAIKKGKAKRAEDANM